MTPQYAARNPGTPIPHLRLHAIDLICSWQIDPASEDSDLQEGYHPFARNSALGFVTMFNDLLSRAVTYQFVRRYPFIFGRWCKQLSTESPFLRSILKSVISIKELSTEQRFQKRCNNILKELVRRSTVAMDTVSAVLGGYADYMDDLPDGLSSPGSCPSIDDGFLIAMKKIYEIALPRKRFKGTSRIAQDMLDEEEMMAPVVANRMDSDSPGPNILDPPDDHDDESEDVVLDVSDSIFEDSADLDSFEGLEYIYDRNDVQPLLFGEQSFEEPDSGLHEGLDKECHEAPGIRSTVDSFDFDSDLECTDILAHSSPSWDYNCSQGTQSSQQSYSLAAQPSSDYSQPSHSDAFFDIECGALYSPDLGPVDTLIWCELKDNDLTDDSDDSNSPSLDNRPERALEIDMPFEDLYWEEFDDLLDSNYADMDKGHHLYEEDVCK